MYMRKTILGAASAIALASPAVAADLPVPAPYSQAPGYQSYEYRTAPPVVVEEPAPPVVIERRVVIAPPPVMVEQYPVYAAPRVYAYAGPIWGHGWGWGYRHRFHGGW
jgi:opacity protein-like surface antigen